MSSAVKQSRFSELKKNISRLLIGISETKPIPVHDKTFYPIEFLKDTFEVFVEDFVIEKIVELSDDELIHPSVIRNQIADMMHALSVLEQTVDVNIEELVCKCIMEYFWSENESSYIPRYTEHLCELVQDCESQYDNRLHSFSDPMMSSNAIGDLFSIAGPSIIRTMDRIIMGQIESNIQQIKTNVDTIEDLDEYFPKVFTEQLNEVDIRSLPNLKEIVSLLTPLGGLLLLRDKIQSCLRQHVQHVKPILYHVVQSCPFEDQSYAQYAGLNADSPLKEILDNRFDDATAQMLSSAFALSLLQADVIDGDYFGWFSHSSLRNVAYTKIMSLANRPIAPTVQYMVAILHQIKNRSSRATFWRTVLFIEDFVGLLGEGEVELEGVLPKSILMDAEFHDSRICK